MPRLPNAVLPASANASSEATRSLLRSNLGGAVINPVGGALGARIDGIALRETRLPAAVTTLRAALNDHGVIELPGQRLDLDDFERIARAFGPAGETPYIGTLDGHPGVIRVIKEADELLGTNFGGGWHSDFSFQRQPPAYTLLYAIDTPPAGGDTLYASMWHALDALSPMLQSVLAPLDGIHSAAPSYGPAAADYSAGMEHMDIRLDAAAGAQQPHPLICTHSESGHRHLFVNGAYTIGIAGMAPHESAPLIELLHAHSTQPVFQYRLRWRPGTLAIWDNRTTQHYALGDYHGQRRETWRATVAGPQPSR